MIIGCGGGKVIDTARAAADQVKAPLVVMPTAASNDSPCSALSVIHDEKGKVTELRQVRRNPDMVLVDTDIIINAPVRLFVAGMGDALATWFEARACAKSGATTTAGGMSSYSALCLAELCYKTLIEFGAQAKADAVAKNPSEAFERVVHANTYLSGIGFESGGVAAAHGINDGFSVIPEAAKILHGELVGFGTLCLLMLEKADSDEIATVANFMRAVGLPLTLGQLGFDDVTEEFILVVADAACSTPVMGNMPFDVTPQMVFNAIVEADSYGRQLLCK
jgi:glycerol dehydrogenase